ncbi:MAG: hypothetical protein QMD73_09490, partial [Rhodocyclaceae bacterium]|nr:hypothetical protein [Rhodocyclaceae bacterium]
LSHIADVLGLARQGQLAEKLRARAAQIQERVQSGQEADERLLMGVAESVLSVESTLSDWGVVSPLEKADDHAGQVAAGDSTPEAEAEHRRVLGELVLIQNAVEEGRLRFARLYVSQGMPAWFRNHLATMDAALAACLKRAAAPRPTAAPAPASDTLPA